MDLLPTSTARLRPPAQELDDVFELLEAIADGVLVVDVDHERAHVAWASGSCVALLGGADPRARDGDAIRCLDTGVPLGRLLADPPPRMRLALGAAHGTVGVEAAVRAYGAPGRYALALTRLADDWLARSALDLPLPTVVFTRDRRVRWINDAAVRVVGMPREQLLGRAWADLVPEARERLPAFEGAVGGDGGPYTQARVAVTFPGQQQRWFRAHCRPLRDRSGEPDGLIAIAEELTDLHAAERGRDLAERRFDALADNLLDLVSVVAPDGTILMQIGSQRVTGVPAAERIGRSSYECVHPDDRARYREWLARLAASAVGEVQAPFVLRVLHADGDWRTQSVRGTNLLPVPGVGGLLLQMRDDTERQAAQQTLRRTQRSLQLVMGAARLGFFEYDPSSDTLDMSDEFYAMRRLDPGIERARPRRNAWRDVHPEDREFVRAQLARVLADPTVPWNVEFRMSTGDGEWLWVLQFGHVHELDARGRGRRLVGAVLDVDRRKRAERGLRHSESRYRTLVALVPGFLHESGYDANGNFVLRWASDGFTRLLGWTPEEINARGGWDTLLHPDDAAGGRQRRDAVLRGADTRAELRLLTKSGRIVWVTTHGYPLQDPDSGEIHCLMGMVHDVTHLKDTEAALRRSEERFRMAAAAFNGIIYEYEFATGTVQRFAGVREVVGFDPAEIAPTIDGWRALVHPADLAELARPQHRIAGPGGTEVREFRYRVRRADGSYADIWDRALLLRDAEGQPRRSVGCAIDVTSERRKERLLAEAEGAARVGSWELDAVGGRLTWSDENYRLHETARDEFEPTIEGALAFFAPEYRDAMHAALRRALGNGAPWDVEAEVVGARGRRFWIRSSARAELVDGRVLRLYGACVDVDEQKRAELLVKRQSDWLRTSFDAAALSAWRWFPDVDEAVIEHRGASVNSGDPDRGTLGSWLARVEPPFRDALRAALLATADDGTPTDMEYRVRARDGEPHWVITRATRVLDGNRIVVTGTTQDVTARRAVEDRLRASEAVLRSVAEHAPDFIVIIDPDLRVQFANKPLRGLPPATVVGRHIDDFAIGPLPEMHENMYAVLRAGESRSYEGTITHADGTVRWYECRMGPIVANGSIAGACAFVTDITDRRAADRRLRAQASVLATMLEGVAVVDATGVVQFTNAAFDRMFGVDRGALERRPLRELFVDGRSPAPAAGARAQECAGRRADGTVFDATAVVSALELGGRPHVVYVLQDVTERRALERELLEIANREQRRIGSDLHDGLGQELTGVALLLSGLASRVRRGTQATTGEVEELVALVNGAIESTRSLARGLSPVELERGGLVYALRSLAVRGRELYGLDVKFRSRVWPKLTLDAAATTHLYRIAQEALTNAARHAQATQVTILLNARGRRVTLSVTDDGRGLPADGGTGMGLRIMRYRARMMDGELLLERVAPTGTRVMCRLRQPAPADGGDAADGADSADGADGAAADAADPAPRATARGLR